MGASHTRGRAPPVYPRCSTAAGVPPNLTGLGLAGWHGTSLQRLSYIQAHIAQLRLIAAEIVTTLPTPNTESNASESNSCKRPKNDTGFWTTVDAKFIQLVEMHGADYNSPGWRIWETQIISADLDRFANLASQLPLEAISHWASAGNDPED